MKVFKHLLQHLWIKAVELSEFHQDEQIVFVSHRDFDEDHFVSYCRKHFSHSQTLEQNPFYSEEELQEYERQLTNEENDINQKSAELQKQREELERKQEELNAQRMGLLQVMEGGWRDGGGRMEG